MNVLYARTLSTLTGDKIGPDDFNRFATFSLVSTLRAVEMRVFDSLFFSVDSQD